MVSSTFQSVRSSSGGGSVEDKTGIMSPFQYSGKR